MSPRPNVAASRFVLIIDSQVHLWEHGPASPRHRQTPFTIEEALTEMAKAGVVALINHPPGRGPEVYRYAERAATTHPDKFATIGSLDLKAEGALDRVRTWRSIPGMIGLRFLCLPENEHSWPTDGTLDAVWPIAEAQGIPVVLCGPYVLPFVEGIARSHPNLKITIDHFGFIGFAENHGLIQSPDILSWATLPNVSVKLTGGPDYAQDQYPYKSLHGVIHALYDAYGPERLFWGTDLTRLPCSWRQAVTMFTEEMAWLSDADMALIMGEAFCRWFDWRPAGC